MLPAIFCLQWLESVQKLEKAETYTKEVDQLYHALFGVR
jgi:hypothetical protein